MAGDMVAKTASGATANPPESGASGAPKGGPRRGPLLGIAALAVASSGGWQAVGWPVAFMFFTAVLAITGLLIVYREPVGRMIDRITRIDPRHGEVVFKGCRPEDRKRRPDEAPSP